MDYGLQDAAWQPKHGLPRHQLDLFEECTFLLRCLYQELPLTRVLVPTRTSKVEPEFARRYGPKFADLVKQNAAITSCGRLATARALPVLQDWLLEMSRNGTLRKGGTDFGAVPERKRKRGLNQFDWDGWFSYNQAELETMTEAAMLVCRQGVVALRSAATTTTECEF